MSYGDIFMKTRVCISMEVDLVNMIKDHVLNTKSSEGNKKYKNVSEFLSLCALKLIHEDVSGVGSDGVREA